MTNMNSNNHQEIIKVLLQEKANMHQIIPKEFQNSSFHIFNFSKENNDLIAINFENRDEFSDYITNTLIANNCTFGIGGYSENRIIYNHSSLFDTQNESRSVHLGIDIWMPENTPIVSPLDAIVHSFQDNDNLGDYGPTVILEHSISGIIFYTLYGHLSRKSLRGLHVGKTISKGGIVGNLGSYEENGGWPPHLHFQIISDMLGKSGDFPGVSSPREKDTLLQLCPDPNLILNIL